MKNYRHKMTKLSRDRNGFSRDRNGMILLIVLGMLAMFSLLAVTYVITSGSSVAGSRALRVRDRNAAFDIRTLGVADKVTAQVVRGSANRDSVFFMNSLLGDVYGPDAIRSNFGPYLGTYSVIHLANTIDTNNDGIWDFDPQRSVNLVKVSINPDAELNGPLSEFENEYNSRILTVLEGPLAGNSYRIHKYVGYVNAGTPADHADPNHLVQPAIPTVENTPQGPLSPPRAPLAVPWTPTVYDDPTAEAVRYSIVIDLNETRSNRLTGDVVSGEGVFRTESRSIGDWVSSFGVESLFFAKTTAGDNPNANNMAGYKFIINDAPFNYPGIGLEDVPNISTTLVNSFGNLDSRGLFINPRVSPSLLTNYNYLNDPALMRVNPYNGTTGVDTVGTRRTHHLESRLIGASNEGYDVPDWRDPWLAHQSYTKDPVTGDVPRMIIPSFHRPEVINYITHLFGNPSALNATQVGEMLRLIQASTGRVLNISFPQGGISQNPRFQMSNANYPKLQLTWSNPPNMVTEVTPLRNYIGALINGTTASMGTPFFGNMLVTPVWDVDNDGDNQTDGVWLDPGMDIVYAPDGRRLKPLISVLIEDLDSRVNLNTAGDRAHGLSGFATAPTDEVHKRKSTTRDLIAQGFGYGPAEISLNSLFMQGTNVPLSIFRSGPTNFSFFDQRYGARRYFGAYALPINYNNTALDRVPGRRRLSGANSENDPITKINEREQHNTFTSMRMPGFPLGRRGSVGVGIDVFGNPVITNPAPIDGDPYTVPSGDPTNPNPAMGGIAGALSETNDDPYESNAMIPANMDDPLGLGDLEAILRRFDSDNERLPSRLKEHLQQIPNYSNMSDINNEITTRSAELRYPNIAAAMKTVKNYGGSPVVAIESGAPSYMRYIQMLHSQRYRQRTLAQFNTVPGGTYPTLTNSDDPQLTYAAINELFPVEFARGLRMDLNRPFGNGYDEGSPNNGDIDDPAEIAVSAQNELHPTPGGIDVAAITVATDGTVESLYGRELKQERLLSNDGNLNKVSRTRKRLASRQVLARNLYCLAQLLVPREYDFPGMSAYRDPTTKEIRRADVWPRAKIRARALAQWAVNIVDYRDADSTMTRFEYDILPFGTGTFIDPPASIRPPYWAPDHLLETVNGVSNRLYCDVVWGIEYPELLLTESFAYHNKNLRDTDMDASGKRSLNETDDANRDPHLDQFRFMDAGLFLELYNPRTVTSSSDPVLGQGISSLYAPAGSSVITSSLQLGKLAPAPDSSLPAAERVWGQQPIWRIAISEQYTNANRNEHPQVLYEAGNLSQITLQNSTETIGGGTSVFGNSNLAAAGSVEEVLGNGLIYHPLNSAIINANPASLTAATAGVKMPVAFDRFIWFTQSRPGTSGIGSRVPDLNESDATRAQRHIYTPNADAKIEAGHYLVVGPKPSVNFGTLIHNQFTGIRYPDTLLRSSLSDVNNRLQRSPSFQGMGIYGSGFETRNLFDKTMNLPWITNSLPPQFTSVRTESPGAHLGNDPWNTNDRTIFGGGVGINVSLPTPYHGETIWTTQNLPNRAVNSADRPGGAQPRPDNTAGFGGNIDGVRTADGVLRVPLDSWVDLANSGSDVYPDEPIDRKNPLIGVNPVSGQDAGQYRSGSYENVRAAYLQRLADPNAAYHPIANPYITVDWISIDLTVFNGETDEIADERDALNQMDVPDPYTPPTKTHPFVFQSRYKTGTPVGTTTPGVTYLSPDTKWKTATPFAKQTAAIPDLPAASSGGPLVKAEAYFMYSLGQEGLVTNWNSPGASSTTFGFLNSGNVSNPDVTAGNEPNASEVADTTKAIFDGFGRPGASSNPRFRGAGENMAGLFWLDRQFASPHEIMLVPRSDHVHLGMEFGRPIDRLGTWNVRSAPSYLNSFQLANPVQTAKAPATLPVNDWNALDTYWAIPRTVTAGEWFADWNLLLEFVETQPPFADANKYFRPDVMSQVISLAPTGQPERPRIVSRFLSSHIPANYFSSVGITDTFSSRGPSFLAPFHYNSNYVAAGKINLNTIRLDSTGRSRALKAMEYLYLSGADRTTEFGNHADTFVTQFASSRRGYDNTNASALTNSFLGAPANREMHPAVPTRFAGAYVPPLLSNIAPPSTTDPSINAVVREQNPVERTLLRSNRASGIPNVTGPNYITPPTNDPLLLAQPLNDAVSQSSMFDQLQRVSRLPNLTTNQSNIFAVWVTVGLFEYDPIDGFGDEYQTPTGGIERERKFYIIDRTVPVGFKQGEDLNYRNMILLERTIP